MDFAYVKVVTLTTHWVPYQSQHCWLRQLWTEQHQQTFKVLFPQMRKHHKVKDRNRKGDGYLQPCRPFRRAPWAPSELPPTGRDIHTGRHICTGRGANFGILLRCRILGDPLGRCSAPLASRHWRYLNSLGWFPGGFLCFSFFVWHLWHPCPSSPLLLARRHWCITSARWEEAPKHETLFKESTKRTSWLICCLERSSFWGVGPILPLPEFHQSHHPQLKRTSLTMERWE